jgi:4-phospho-D-threonate 3-dehydrogenase / 4-phospho-D-erythronate 3-dehydrogenase
VPAQGPHPVLVLADDLSGAAETAAVLMSRTMRTELVLVSAARDVVPSPADVVVVDLDDREQTPAEAATRTGAVLGALPAGTPLPRVLAKFDSLLRGNLAARLGPLQARGGVVVAPALPALRRVVRDGTLSIDGVPLSETRAWVTQGVPAPETVAAACAPLPTVLLDLPTVRSGRLSTAVADAVRNGRVPVCDGETDADLDAVVAAVTALSAELPDVALAGSAGLAAALGRTWSAAPGAPPAPRPDGPGPLVVVGTAEETAAVQVARLADAGVSELRLPAAALLTRAPDPAAVERLGTAVTAGPVVVRPDPTATLAPADSRRLSAGLGDLVGRALSQVGGPVDLVLTGGETARRVLDALGITRLTPLGQVHHGAVLCRLPDGGSVVTRPGSFGGPDSLLSILAALHPLGRSTPPLTTASPRGSTEGTP